MLGNMLLWGVAVLAPVAATAAELTVQVRTAAGLPVRDAVVMLHPAGAASRLPARFDAPLAVTQKDIQFQPFVLVVPVGASVEFPNRDSVRHHVYSFSKAKRFELKLYGREEKRSVLFDKPGAVAIGCNIHDRMSAFVRVVDTPFAMKTDANGAARLLSVPAGVARLTVWHPHLRAPGNEVGRRIAVEGAPLTESISIDIRAPSTP